MKLNHYLEYRRIIKDILSHNMVLKMDGYKQHGFGSTYDHCERVSRYSYFVCKKLRLNYQSAARAGMLHDFFLYDWTEENMSGSRHLWVHPLIAAANAEKYFAITEKERNIIVSHMFPMCNTMPRSMESIVVSIMDKYAASLEFSIALWISFRKKIMPKRYV